MIYTFSRIVRRKLTREELPEKAVALNITPSVDTFSGSVLTPAHVMAFVQRSWRISEAGSADANWLKYVGLYLPDSDDPERNPVRYYES